MPRLNDDFDHANAMLGHVFGTLEPVITFQGIKYRYIPEQDSART